MSDTKEKSTNLPMAGEVVPGVPVLLSVEDLAKVLRTTRKAIYSMVARGELPGIFRRGRRRVYFRREAIVAWIEAGTESSPKKQQPWVAPRKLGIAPPRSEPLRKRRRDDT